MMDQQVRLDPPAQQVRRAQRARLVLMERPVLKVLPARKVQLG
jgi:hypothetical protein